MNKLKEAVSSAVPVFFFRITFVVTAAALVLQYANAYIPDPLCPFPSKTTTYFANPNDCSQFYECYEGRKFTMYCNENLLWNQDKLQCDYQQNVRCARQENPCEDQLDGTYLENPDDCTKFYACEGHKTFDAQCPTGSVWNQQIRICDHITNVTCKK
ncbi:hypothetical protein NQ317_007999 [Molorchus minor]|uniref:Chitin-binding type-2 domain-containing protein n=1 Tax=Molorchus minor TaxID=1323400 RepID=A0ABQ9J128_9CUCU|nr:hypothetical protein NQ317_007999 [Molorchus minor]